MEKIYAAPINGDWYAVFVGDKKLTVPLSESDAKKIADRYNVFEELETENLQLVGDITVLQIENSSAAKEIKRLKLQNEVLSAAFANSSEKEKDLMAERDEMLDALKRLIIMARTSGGTAGRDEGLVLACEFAESVIQKADVEFSAFDNPADLDEF